jgi:ribosome-associated protein
MELLELIKDALDKVKATDVKIYDLRGISPLCDFTVVATVDVARQANAVIDYLNLEERNQKLKIRNVEGRETTWILLDLYDVILHVFTPEERKNFDLDRLYLNIPQIN